MVGSGGLRGPCQGIELVAWRGGIGEAAGELFESVSGIGSGSGFEPGLVEAGEGFGPLQLGVGGVEGLDGGGQAMEVDRIGGGVGLGEELLSFLGELGGQVIGGELVVVLA